MRSLSDQIHDECSDVIDGRFGRLTSSSLVQNDEGLYAYPHIDTNGSGRRVLSDEVQVAITDAVRELRTLVDTPKSHAVSCTEAVTWTPESDSVYVSLNVACEREATEEAVASVTELAASASPRASASAITSVECSQSLYPSRFVDGTVAFRTETPHELLADISSLEEYAEWRAECDESLSVDDVLAMDDYEDHYHLSDADVVERICAELTASFYDAVDVTQPVRKGRTAGSLSVGGMMSGTVHAFARVSELE